MNTDHQTLPIRPARHVAIERFVNVSRHQTPSVADIETMVLVATIAVLALCIVGSFVYLIRSMVPTV